MVYVYDRACDEWLIRDIPPDAPMPGTKRQMLSARAFVGADYGETVWSELEALNAAELLTLYTGEPLTYAFRRMRERPGQSAHNAGLAFHFGRRLTTDRQNYVMRYALEVCGFDFVEPVYLTPGWVHAEKRIEKPAGLFRGFPALCGGDKGAHVMTLQQALLFHGVYKDALTGCYTSPTRNAVALFQKENDLNITGEADASTWSKLMASD